MIITKILNKFRNEIKLWKYKRSTDKVYLYDGVSNIGTSFRGHNTLFKDVSCIDCEIGEFTYIQYKTFLLRTKIGKFCSIADHVRTGFGNHPTQMVSSWPGFYYDTTTELKYSFHKKAPVIDILRTTGGGANL